jgi:hypothetical protein
MGEPSAVEIFCKEYATLKRVILTDSVVSGFSFSPKFPPKIGLKSA